MGQDVFGRLYPSSSRSLRPDEGSKSCCRMISGAYSQAFRTMSKTITRSESKIFRPKYQATTWPKTWRRSWALRRSQAERVSSRKRGFSKSRTDGASTVSSGQLAFGGMIRHVLATRPLARTCRTARTIRTKSATPNLDRENRQFVVNRRWLLVKFEFRACFKSGIKVVERASPGSLQCE